MATNQQGILLVLSGFSGAGKGTLVKKLMEMYPEYVLSVSMTTRTPREGEQDGVHYFFRTKQAFEAAIAADGFLEYASFVGNYYGTPKAYVEEQLRAGKNVILEIELQGAMQVKERLPQALLLFVTPPSAKELERRLRGRGTETEEVIQKRLARAKEEARFMDAYEYIVVNDDLETCAKEVHALVDAARHEPLRRQAFLQDLKDQLQRF